MADDKLAAHFPDSREFKLLREKHPTLLQALDDIAAGFNVLFELVNEQDGTGPNKVLYLLIGASYTEFEEILVLALNGYGSGSTKLLRALYERTVTAQYLMSHPDKVKQFIDYTDVHWMKLLREADTCGVGENLSKGRREEIETSFAKVEAAFTAPECESCSKGRLLCDRCNKNRLQGSWTKKPVHTQASELDKDLRLFYFGAYLMPTFFLHTTFWGIQQQIRHHGNGKSELHNREVELDQAARAIAIACNVMAILAFSINAYYKLKAEDHCKKIAVAVNHIGPELWSKDEGAIKTEGSG